MKLWTKIIISSILGGALFLLMAYYQNYIDMLKEGVEEPPIEALFEGALPYGGIFFFISLLAGIAWNWDKIFPRKPKR
jgi:hypothetical protein